MKPILSIILFLTVFKSYGQFKNYKIEKNKVKTEKMFSDIATLEIVQKKNPVKLSPLAATDLAGFFVERIVKIPSYIQQYLKKRRLKFTSTYEAKNTLENISKDWTIDQLIFKRDAFLEDKKGHQNGMTLKLKSKLVQNDKFLAFNAESLIFTYSKAKIKSNAPIVNLLVEINIHYTTTKDSITLEKTEMKSASLVIPVDMRTGDNKNISIVKNQFSDVFLPNNISEISVKVTEINPHKLKLEDLEDFITENNEDLSALFAELSNVLKK